MRKHTYLLIAVLISAILLFFLPFILVNGHCLFTIVPSGMAPDDIIIFSVLNLLIIATCILCVTIYKNQRLQFILTNALILMNGLIYGLFFSLYYDALFNGNKGMNLGYGIGFYVPLIEIILLLLAAYNIKKAHE